MQAASAPPLNHVLPSCLNRPIRKQQLHLPVPVTQQRAFLAYGTGACCSSLLDLIHSASVFTTTQTALPLFGANHNNFLFLSALGQESHLTLSHHPHATHLHSTTHTHTQHPHPNPNPRIHTITLAIVLHAMILSIPILSALLLPLLTVASPTPTPTPTPASVATLTQHAISSLPIATPPPERREAQYAPEISIPPVVIPSRTPYSRKPYTRKPYTRIETCTPGFSAYATPGVDGYAPPGSCNAMWPYFPNFAAAVAFSVMFGVLTLVHIGQATAYRNGFCWVVIMAGLWETGAYAFRALGSKDQQSSGIALVSQILVLVGPVCKCLTQRQSHLLSLTSLQGSMPLPTWFLPA